MGPEVEDGERGGRREGGREEGGRREGEGKGRREGEEGD